MAREMRNSGVKWIGEIPSNWACQKLKYSLSANDGGVWGDEPKDDGNTLVLRSTEQTIDGKWSIVDPAPRYLRNISNRDFYLCKAGDLLVTKSSGSQAHIGKTSLVNKEVEDLQCCYSNFLQRLHLKEGCCEQFYWYILNSNVTRLQFAYRQNATSGLGNINSTDIDNIFIPLPPLSEQKVIADFLDAKCGEIDGLLADLDAEVKTLTEYKKSLIAETVTRGLNPNAPMKSSGIPWVGEIPKHWRVIANKYIMQKKKEIVPIYGGQDIISLSMNGVIVRDLDAGGKMPTSFNGYQHIYPGNLLMCLFDIDVTPRCIGLIKNEGLTSPAYSQFIVGDEAYAPYYYYFYLKMDNNKELVHLSKNMRHSLNEEQFGMIKTIFPPMDEQIAIANYLDSKCAAIDQAITGKTQQIETLKAYKSSLIYEYVTGKKQVL